MLTFVITQPPWKLFYLFYLYFFNYVKTWQVISHCHLNRKYWCLKLGPAGSILIMIHMSPAWMVNGFVLNCDVIHSYLLLPTHIRGIYICIHCHITYWVPCRCLWQNWPLDLLWPWAWEWIGPRLLPSRCPLLQEDACCAKGLLSHPSVHNQGSKFLADPEQGLSWLAALCNMCKKQMFCWFLLWFIEKCCVCLLAIAQAE